MRYLPITQLKEKMVLGEELYDNHGHMLLSKHTELSKENIAFLSFMGIEGVYIDDEFSEEAKIEEIVRPEVKRSALLILKKVFFNTENGMHDEDQEMLAKEVDQVVREVISNRDVMFNVMNVKRYDDLTFYHSVNVAILAGVIGAKMKMTHQEVTDLVTAGFLHDIGKVFIDRDILMAPRKLTYEERVRMMDHPRLGYEFLKEEYNFNDNVLNAVYEHHEFYDGSGYPRRLKGDEIAPVARILKAADVYDAMTGRRTYHEPYLPSDVLEYIMGRNGMEFDPNVTRILATEFCIYPAGCEVQLSDGRKAIVLANHKGFVNRPLVKVLKDGEKIDLAFDRDSWDITIVKLLV